MSATDPLALDQQLCFAVYSTSLAMTQVYKPLLAEIGLTYPQYLIMLALWEREGITVRELAERLHQESGSLSPVLKRMEADGYLLRRRDPQDERNLALTLTPEGRALRDQARTVNQSFGSSCALAPDELTSLRDSLVALRVRLTAVAGTA